MKRLCLPLCALLAALSCLFFYKPTRVTPAAATDGVQYALLPEDTVLYAAAADGYVPMFTMPRTYFVILLSADKNGYTSASWLDVTGFVETAKVEAVDYTPVTKYPTRNLTAANDRNPVNIRSAPDHTADNIIGAIPDGASAAVYGETTGSELIPQVGGLWYYVRYTENDRSVYGYVYSAQVAAEPVTENVIERETPAAADPVEEDGELGASAKIGVIAALTVPAVIVMLLIFRPAPKNRKPRQL